MFMADNWVFNLPHRFNSNCFFFQDFNWVNTPKSSLSKGTEFAEGKFENDIQLRWGNLKQNVLLLN